MDSTVVMMSNIASVGPHAGSTAGLTKKCRVCGDRALAFNFNGLSCESCKAFFRRNALRQDELACLQGGNCDIDMSTRKFCPRCRLDKCFTIGMRKELVMAREEKSVRRKRVVPTGPASKKSPENLNSTDSLMREIIEAENPRYSPPNASPTSSDQEKADMEQMLIHSAFEFGHFEQERFDEVKRASLVFLHKPYCALKLTGEANLMQAFNLQETYIKKIIEFCKGIDAFHCLKSTDQLTIIKGFFTESLTIRCAYHYDAEQDGFPVRTNEFAESACFVRLDIIFPADKQDNLDQYRKYIYSLHNEIEDDKNIRDLLITMSIFKPKDQISCPEFIRYHYFSYCRLFLRYLEQKYRDIHKASQKYCKLMHFMDRMWHIREIIFDTHMDIDTALVAHVLAEIYHLNKSPEPKKPEVEEEEDDQEEEDKMSE